MATPCLCGQATSTCVCSISAGPGINVSGAGTVVSPYVITAQSALAWVSYTPTLTNFTLGNGVNGSRYLLNGKTVDVVVALRFGTTSTFTATAWQISLPAGLTAFFDPSSITNGHVRGRCSMKDASAALFYKGEVYLSNTGGPIRVRFGDDATGIGAAGDLKQGVPFTWTNLDELVLMTRLEIV